jgi:NAD(P)-dependent dehydrogenase (short-subunit alcohol dehydrogenase family)
MGVIRLDGEVIVVTGGASGIGRACALGFAEAGARVVILDVNEESAVGVVKEVGDVGSSAVFIPTDCAVPMSISRAFKEIGARFGTLRAAVNAAATMGSIVPFAECSFDEWAQVISLNLTGLFLCVQSELRLMSTGAAVVNIASLAGIRGVPSQSAYTASKHGVVGLTKSVALEYAAQGIRVNAICPGLIETPMATELARVAGVPLHSMLGQSRRLGQPSEVASTALWLCSDLASFVTGQAIAVDGGNSAASGGARVTG